MTATEQVAADLDAVLHHLFCDEEHRYGVHDPDPAQARARLACHVAKTRFSNPEHVATVMSWVRWGLHWTVQHRALSVTETCVLAAAVRVAEYAEMLVVVERLGEAIAEQHWAEARQLWLQLGPHHALLIGAHPHAEYLTYLLQDHTTQPPIH
jgi:hypothetical protein